MLGKSVSIGVHERSPQARGRVSDQDEMEVSEDNAVVQKNPEMSVEKECKAGKYQAGGFKGVNGSWLRR